MVRTAVPTSPYAGERLGQVRSGEWLVTELRFGAGDRLAPHAHGNAIITCVVSGRLTEQVARQSFSLTDRQCYVRPAGEPHSNIAGPDGARMVLIESRADRERLDPVVGRLLGELALRPARGAAAAARRLAHELRLEDAATPLAVEGLVLSLVGALVRREARTGGRSPGRALPLVKEYLDAHFRSPVRLATLAALAGVGPGELARAFRRAFGLSPAGYQRALQIGWVTEQLADRDRTISQIAAEAGFADHSHLTRCYRATTGRTPSEVRRGAHPLEGWIADISPVFHRARIAPGPDA